MTSWYGHALAFTVDAGEPFFSLGQQETIGSESWPHADELGQHGSTRRRKRSREHDQHKHECRCRQECRLNASSSSLSLQDLLMVQYLSQAVKAQLVLNEKLTSI